MGEVISPSAEDTPVVDGLLNSVQRAVKAVQAKLEASQAATFGKDVSAGCCLWVSKLSNCLISLFLAGPASHSSGALFTEQYLRGHQAL